MSGGFIVRRRAGQPASWEVLSPAGRVAAITYMKTEADKVAEALGWKDPATAPPSAPVGVIGDAIRHLSKWLDANDCECESGHQCGRTEVERTRDQLRALAQQPAPSAPMGVSDDYRKGWEAGRIIQRALAQKPAAVTQPAGGDVSNGSQQPAAVNGARPLDEWHEDDGPVVWWKPPVDEPAWIGTPLDSDWPGYYTHWTPHPAVPALAAQPGGDQPSAGMSPDDRGRHVR